MILYTCISVVGSQKDHRNNKCLCCRPKFLDVAIRGSLTGRPGPIAGGNSGGRWQLESGEAAGFRRWFEGPHFVQRLHNFQIYQICFHRKSFSHQKTLSDKLTNPSIKWCPLLNLCDWLIIAVQYTVLPKGYNDCSLNVLVCFNTSCCCFFPRRSKKVLVFGCPKDSNV